MIQKHINFISCTYLSPLKESQSLELEKLFEKGSPNITMKFVEDFNSPYLGICIGAISLQVFRKGKINVTIKESIDAYYSLDFIIDNLWETVLNEYIRSD